MRNDDAFDLTNVPNLHLVEKARIAENGEWNLSGEKYRSETQRATFWPMVELGKVARLINGRAYKQEELLSEGQTPVLRVGNFFSNRGWYYSNLELEEDKYCDKGDLLYAWSASFGPRIWEGPRAIYHYHIWKVETTDQIEKKFLFYLLEANSEKIKSEGNGIAMVHTTKSGMEQRKFPLPHLDVQKDIVTELDGYQKIIDGARQVVENYQPRIHVESDWPMVGLEKVTFFQEGPGILAKDFKDAGVPLVRLAGLGGYEATLDGCNFIDPAMIQTKWSHFRLNRGDILVSTSASFGRPSVVGSKAEGAIFYTGIIRFRSCSPELEDGYLNLFLGSHLFLDQGEALASGSVIRHFGPSHLRQMFIALPPLQAQRAIVAQIEEEQRLVDANRELVKLFEAKVKASINRVWGEAE